MLGNLSSEAQDGVQDLIQGSRKWFFGLGKRLEVPECRWFNLRHLFPGMLALVGIRHVDLGILPA